MARATNSFRVFAGGSGCTTYTGAFVLAGFYQRDAAVTSLAILVTTVASAATLPVVLWLLR